MSELNNKYLDFSGLQKYDERIKAYIGSADQKLSEELTALIIALDEKIGNLEIEGSDDKNLSEIVADIYSSINDIIDAQDKLSDKDGELEKAIADIIGEMSESDSIDLMTLVEISNKLKNFDELTSQVSQNTEDIKDVESRVGSLETAVGDNTSGLIKAVADLRIDVEGMTGDAGSISSQINTAIGNLDLPNTYEAKGYADTLVKDAEGKSLFDAAGSAATAEQNAKDYADSLATNYDASGSAATAEQNAKDYADSLATNYDASGSAATAEQNAKDYADSLATNYDTSGSAATAEQNAKDYADGLAGNYDASGSAATAEQNAKDYADGLATNYDASGSAATAEQNAKDYADGLVMDGEKVRFDAAGSAAQAYKDAKAYVDAISHASDVKYEDGFIKLYDADGAVIGNGFDASPFIVDGMIDDVDFVTDDQGYATTILRFTFNIDSADSDNNKKVIDVDFAKYVDVYKGDDTSIVLDSASKTFSVNEVAATKTKTVDTIPVAGGPLESLLKNAGINEIAAGSSIEDILFSLICKELWAKTLTFSEGTVASSIAQPTFTLEHSGETVEVGTKCTLSDITMSAATASISKNRTYSGFTYGYSAANDNTQDDASTSIAASVDVAAALNEGNYTMSRDYTQFNGAADDAATANADASQVKLDGAELTVSYVGSNSVKVTVGGPTASATFAAMPVYYACSNLKKTKDAVKDSEGQYKSDAKDAKTVTSSAASNSKTLTVTGARAYWMGSVKNAIAIDKVTNVPYIDGAAVRAAGESETDNVTKTLGANPTTTVIAKKDDASVIIATQKEIAKINSENQINADIFGNFGYKEVNIEGANGFTSVKYHVYVWTPANVFAKDDTLTITYK